METLTETSKGPDATGGGGLDVCIFCLNSTDTDTRFDASFVKSEVRFDYDGQYILPVSANTSSPSCGLLATEMKAIFIVRKLLSLSELQCMEMLETFGNPSNWLAVCKSCGETVDKALRVHKRIIKLEKELETVKEEATSRIRASDQNQRKRNRSLITEATSKIRRYVLNDQDIRESTISSQRESDDEIKEESDAGVWDEVDVTCNESLGSLSDPDYIPDGTELEFEYEETEDYTGAVSHENVTVSAIRTKSQSRKTRRSKQTERQDVSSVLRLDRQPHSYFKHEKFDKVGIADMAEDADNNATNEVVIKIEDGELKSYYRCSRCSYKSYRRSDLVRHLKNVHGCYSRNSKTLRKDKRKICVLCNQVFTSISSFHTHCINQHKMMSCNKCPRLFSTVSTLHAHQKKHTITPTSVAAMSSQKFSCPHCSFSTKSLSYLNRHRRCIHGEMTKKMIDRSMKQNQCNECNKTFEDTETFKKHCISDHQMSQCPKCPMLFPTISRLKSHELRHHQDSNSKGRVLQCQHCDYSSTALVHLNRHVRDVHWEIGNRVRLSLMRKSKCGQCHKICESMDALRTHCLETHEMKECFKCPKVFATEELLGAHLRRFHATIKSKPKLKIKLEFLKEKTSTYKCPHCYFFSTAEPRLSDHIRIVHKELAAIISGKLTADNLKCEKCSKQFPSMEELIQHKIDEHEMVKCEECLRVFPYVGYLELHQKRYHSEDAAARKVWKWTAKPKPVANDSSTTENTDCVTGGSKMQKPNELKNHNCTKCPETFLTYRDLKSHLTTTHAEKMLKCDKCSEVFDSMSSLFSHKVNVHHEQKSLYQCPQCTYTNKNYRRIAKHLDVVHDEKPKLVCEICSKSYKTERTLLFHKIGEHGQVDTRYDTQCNICNKSFSTPYYLKNHVTTVHENRWRYKCDECGMGFRGRKQVETHVQVYHRNIRQFKCPKEGCDKEYGTKSQLNNHLRHARGHMENKEKLKCSFSECSAAFVDKHDLKRHELIHINKDKKPFQCHQCGKGFTLVDYLRQHLKSCVRKDDTNSK